MFLVLNGDEGEMPELAGVVESVADNELVLDFESDIFNRYVHLSSAGLAQEAGGFQARRIAGAKDFLKVGQRDARVDDVFDDDDMAVFERNIEILQQPDLARAFGRGAVARDRDEIERHGSRHRPGEIGEKDKRALEHGDKVQRFALAIVAIDLGSQLTDTRVNLVGGKQRRHNVWKARPESRGSEG